MSNDLRARVLCHHRGAGQENDWIDDCTDQNQALCGDPAAHPAAPFGREVATASSALGAEGGPWIAPPHPRPKGE